MLLILLASAFAGCDDKPEIPSVVDPAEGDFFGPHRVIVLGEETDGLQASEIEISIQAENGVEFVRTASHSRIGGSSTISLDRGLAEGTYRLLAARYPVMDVADADGAEDESAEFGLGSRIRVTDGGITVIDSFDPVLGYTGRGSKEEPYVVSSSSHLFNLMMLVNDYDSNRQITEDTYFMQVCDIDMKQMSRSCDMDYGWLPIGADVNTPFRGVYLGNGHVITNLIINRPNSAGIGLFGFVYNASVDALTMRSCSVVGQYGVGTVAGAVITSGGGERGQATFTNCNAVDCTLSCPSTSAAIGGILGATDMYVKVLLSDCSTSGGSISGGMNVGGITGGAGIYSSMMVTGCDNSASVSSALSGAGGIVGTADTLQVVGCRNTAAIVGSTDNQPGSAVIGTGGIAGGAGVAWITGSANTGDVTGKEGVGGIIGSTRVRGSESEAYTYNQAVLRHCYNSGNVNATRFAGGAVGEAQAGTYGVCNTGNVTATDYAGGICGAASVAVLHNSVNGGNVKGERYIAGIIGKCTWGSLAIDQNLGSVGGTAGHTAGVVALAGNNTIVNYCANFGAVSGPGSAPVGGIAGEIGDPRKWTGTNIAECVIGSLECIMAFAGPVLAVVEETVELAEAVEVTIKIIETSVEVTLQTSDYALVGYGIAELISPETENELSAEMHAAAGAASDEVRSVMADLRRSGCSGDIDNFSNVSLASAYVDNIDKVVAYYETEGNDEKFNEAINNTRAERAEALEHVAKAHEIFHTVVAGVAVAASTVALIGGTIASGGTATVFLAVGSVAAIVGGTNAIVKSCTEFEKNAVVISQCVNAGKVNAPSNKSAGAIVGKLCDGCELYDCLNAAPVSLPVPDGLFVGDVGSQSEVSRCVSLHYVAYAAQLTDVNKSVMCDPSLSGSTTKMYGRILGASPSALSAKGTYTSLGFSVGSGSTWVIPSTLPFAIPDKSQMQE